MDATRVTIVEIIIGFGLSLGVGVPSAIAIAFSRWTNRAVYPLFVGSQAVPKIALAPVFLVWFGFGELPKVLIATLIGFFPIVINTVVGLKSVDQDLVRMARVTRASRTKIFLKIRVPSALRSFYSGVKLAITFCVIGAVVGEFVAGDSGLGYIIESAEGNQQTALAFVAIVMLAIISICLFYIVEGIEKLTLHGRV